MTTTAEIQKILAEGVARGKRAAVATVVERSGPGPRGPGSQLVLWADGTMMGSVGGGILEGVIEERGRQVLDNGRPAWVSLDLGSGAEEDCGMVCGGKVRVLVDFIDGDRPRVRSFYGEILSELQRQEGSDMPNVNIRTRASIPFMIVFANPPKEVDEFIIELSGVERSAASN